MSDAKTIKAAMIELGTFDEKELSFLTEEYLDNTKRTAKEVVVPKKSDDVGATAVIWTGNHIVVSGRNWTWEDTPGSQCGRTRTWKYTAQVGDSYRQSGTCPQGYVWYTMELNYR